MNKYLTVELKDSEENIISYRLIEGKRLLVRNCNPTYELDLDDLKEAVKELEKYEREAKNFGSKGET